jgi:hypothetical protein
MRKPLIDHREDMRFAFRRIDNESFDGQVTPKRIVWLQLLLPSFDRDRANLYIVRTVGDRFKQ